ncbi:DsrE family protein [Desulfovibrio inopinatus]|uniref:DsrE family protein n=1 Tax=Desulfovibrio inopinatus TaxID=102109 RepID=UPI0004048FCC|nr:DsrE family protein [Desulfovibrio inopinatus]
MQKMALFAFRGEMGCFIHVMLNAIDMKEKGFEVVVVLEGESVKLVGELAKDTNPMHKLFEKTKSLGIFAGACKACSHNFGVLDVVKKEGFTILEEMNGHPSIARFIESGYTILTF